MSIQATVHQAPFYYPTYGSGGFDSVTAESDPVTKAIHIMRQATTEAGDF